MRLMKAFLRINLLFIFINNSFLVINKILCGCPAGIGIMDFASQKCCVDDVVRCGEESKPLFYCGKV